jgi:hypothetical protein
MTTATVAGTVILGASERQGVTTKSSPIGLAGVTVRVSGTSRTAMTDRNGEFTLTNVPTGNPEFSFERQDIHAHGRVTVAAGGMNRFTFAISGDRAEVAPGGHSGLEIEGLVGAVDSLSGAGTFSVLDQRLGAVIIAIDDATVIRNADGATIPFSQIQIGNRVHVKALTQADGTILATQIDLQSDKVGGNRELDGAVASVDEAAGSFALQAGTGTVTVTTNGSTMFKRRGGAASFSDVAVGVNVEVKGILQGDGTILAKKVTIES